MDKKVEERIKQAKRRELEAQKLAASMRDVEIDPWHVTVACGMCEAMGMDPNGRTTEAYETKNWEFLMPGAVAAGILCRPPDAPEGDMLTLADPNGLGFLMRIDKHGVLHLRPDLAPGTPLGTFKHANGDVTLAVGPPGVKSVRNTS